MNVLVTCTVLLNMGDAAILEGLVETLQSAYGSETKIVIHDMDPTASISYYPDTDIQPMLHAAFHGPSRFRGALQRLGVPSRWTRAANERRMWVGARLLRDHRRAARWILMENEYQALAAFRDADVVMTTGGTYLVENYSLKPRILDYQVALFFDKPLVFFTQSLGPFHQPRNQRTLRPIFDQAALVLLRDDRSRRHLLEIGVRPDRLHVVPDSAFALANPSAWKTRSDKAKHVAGPPRIAVSVRDWHHFKRKDNETGMADYTEAVQTLVTRLVREDQADVVFLSTCQGVPEYRLDDSRVAMEMVAGLPQDVRERVHVDQDFHTPSEYQAAVSTCDLVVATRMHAAILSLGAGVPVVPIEYEFKTRELFDKMGLADIVLDIEDVGGDRLTAVVRKTLSDMDSLAPQFERFVTTEFQDSIGVSDLLLAATSA